MGSRTVSDVVTATRTVEGDGFVVWRPFPRPGLDVVDPFLLLDELGPVTYGPGEAIGAGDHPHRGFETVTYLLAGGIEHRDSVGSHGIIGPGGVQWMTAGRGVVHSEQPTDGLRRAGGALHGVQLWVNLPRRDKLTAPRYQDLTADEIPVLLVPADGGADVTVRVIAGDHGGVTGPVETHSPVTYLHLTAPPGTTPRVVLPEDHNAMVYLVGGAARVGADERPVEHHDLAVLRRDGDIVELRVPSDAGGPADVLVLSGRPLREPIARFGPFVMSDRGEILQAIEDHRAGRLA